MAKKKVKKLKMEAPTEIAGTLTGVTSGRRKGGGSEGPGREDETLVTMVVVVVVVMLLDLERR
jgi:hypothetical protein